MNKVVSITDNNQGKLVWEFSLLLNLNDVNVYIFILFAKIIIIHKANQKFYSYLQKVFNFFWVVIITFPANPFSLFDLTGLYSGLNVFEMHIRICTEINN